MKKQAWFTATCMSLIVLLCHCGDDPKKTTTPTPKYSVGGTVTGLTTGTLVIRNNGGDDLTITADGSFTFATKIEDGKDYDVSIKTLPAGGSCSVTAGTGTILGKNVTKVKISCTI